MSTSAERSRAAAARVDRSPGPRDVPPRPPLGRSLLRAARPRQWLKNALVFAAPATGGVLSQPPALARATVAFVAFCLASGGLYLVNDVVDRAVDRLHPVKRNRPVAAGLVPAPLATATSVALVAAAVVTAALGGGLALAVVVGGYVALALAYTFALRGVVLLDLTALAGGFLLRAVAGGVAVGVPLSSWFLIVASFGSLFIATGKRNAEHTDLGAGRGSHRRTLDGYSKAYLHYVQLVSSTVAVTAYCLWAFEGAAGSEPWSGLSIAPFVLGVLRYALLLDAGWGGTPEDLVLADRPLQLCGVAWVLLVAGGVYLG